MTTSQKTFVVICIGQFPDGSGHYIVKRTENVNTRIARVVSYHDTYEEAKAACDKAPTEEQRFTVRRFY